MEECLKIVDEYIRDNISILEKKKDQIQIRINKIIFNYSSRDIEKLNQLSNEVNNIDYTIVQMYALIGGMNRLNGFQKCILCGTDTGEKNLKVCNNCASEYKF